MFNNLPAVLVKYRWLLLVITVLISLVSLTQVNNIRLESGLDSIADPQSLGIPELTKIHQLLQEQKMQAFMVSPKEGDIFNVNAIEAIRQLMKDTGRIPYSLPAQSITNFKRLEISETSIGFRPWVVSPEELNEAALTMLKEEALVDPGLVPYFISPKGDLALVVVPLYFQKENSSIIREVVGISHEILVDIRKQYPEIDFYVIGELEISSGMLWAMTKDLFILSPIMLLGCFLILWFCLRSFTNSCAVFGVTGLVLVILVGMLGWAKVSLNVISLMAPLLVLVIALADAVHVVTIYVQNIRQNMEPKQALEKSLEINIKPIFLTSVTTFLGFTALNFCSQKSLSDFGNIVGLGVCIAFIDTLTVLPTLILIIDPRKIKEPLQVTRLMSWISETLPEKANIVVISVIIFIIATVSLLPLNRIEFDREEFLDSSSERQKAVELFDRKSVGVTHSLFLTVESSNPEGVLNIKFLKQFDEFLADLTQPGMVVGSRSYLDILKIINQANHHDDPDWYRIPETQDELKKLISFAGLMNDFDPAVKRAFGFLNPSEGRIVAALFIDKNLSKKEVLALSERITHWDFNNENDYKIYIGGLEIIMGKVSDKVTQELLLGFMFALVSITLTISIGFRSLKVGLLSLLPNVFPAAIVFGLWGLFVGRIDAYTLMVFSISIGLVVDDTVHLLSKYFYAQEAGSEPESSIRYALHTAGSAIVVTSIVLVVGISIFFFAHTSFFQRVVFLLVPIIITALALDLLFLPALVYKYRESKVLNNIKEFKKAA